MTPEQQSALREAWSVSSSPVNAVQPATPQDQTAQPVAWREVIKRLDAAIAEKWEKYALHFNRDDYIDFFRHETPLYAAQPKSEP